MHVGVPDVMGKSIDAGAWLRDFFSSSGPGRTLLHLRKGETLYKKGGDATKVFMVQRGQIGLVDDNRTLEIAGPNRWLFESAHELGHSFLHTAVALTDCGVMAFDADLFVHTLGHNPILNTKFLTDISDQRSENSNHDPAGKRLARHLLKLCGARDVLILENAAPKSLGMQIGATRQRVTDILKEFHKAGMAVKLSVGRYRLHKRALQQFLGIKRDGNDE